MPEGDTIFRTAASIRKWIGGRDITAARGRVPGVAIEQVIGRSLERVDAVGKHLLMQFTVAEASPLLLRTHMMMTGSWHVYSAGVAWQRPERQARLVLEAGDRLAVCFNAPVIELTNEVIGGVRGVAHLGPDILDDDFAVAEVVRRIRLESPARAIGEVLLDQRLVAGIGNIYRCESMFLEGVHPWVTQGSLSSTQLQALVQRAQQLMRSNLTPQVVARDFTDSKEVGADGVHVAVAANVTAQPWVYRRPNRPCRNCGTSILSRPQGPQARTAYWCPTCQPASGQPASAYTTPGPTPPLA
jgi:endonuclease VIII